MSIFDDVRANVVRIRQAIWGHEVRDSIADSVDGLNDETEIAVNGYTSAQTNAQAALDAAGPAATAANNAADRVNALIPQLEAYGDKTLKFPKYNPFIRVDNASDWTNFSQLGVSLLVYHAGSLNDKAFLMLRLANVFPKKSLAEGDSLETSLNSNAFNRITSVYGYPRDYTETRGALIGFPTGTPSSLYLYNAGVNFDANGFKLVLKNASGRTIPANINVPNIDLYTVW